MRIGNITVEKGQMLSGVLETASYYGGIRVAIPFVVIRGVGDGSFLTALACQHGRELNGIEAIRQVILKVDPMQLRGCAIFIPCANPLAARMRQQDYPYEKGRYLPAAPAFNLNREWPGRADGTLYQQMADVMWREGISRSSICIDIHSWSGRTSSLVWGNALAQSSGFVGSFGLGIYALNKKPSGSGLLGDACDNAKIHNITVELGPQGMLAESSVSAGKRGIMNCMKALGMIDGELELPESQIELDASHTEEHVIKAPFTGLLSSRVQPPALVKQGELFAELVDLDDVTHVFPIVSPFDGVVFNIGPAWGEECKESCVVDPGEIMAVVKCYSRIIRNQINNEVTPVQSTNTNGNI